MPVGGGVVEAPREAAQLGGEDETDGDGGAVPPPVAFAPFDGVTEGVTVVEDLAQARLLEVRGHDLRLDLDRAPDQFGQYASRRVERGLRVRLDQFEDLRIGDEAGLDHLGETSDDLVARHRLERREVDEPRGRFGKGPAGFFPALGVDAGLAADRGVDHGEQRGGDVHDPHAAHPRGGDEPGQVGGRSPAEADDRVGSGQPDAAEHLPAEARHGEVLAVLGVGDLDAVSVDALLCQRGAHRLGGLRERRLVQDRHGAGAGEFVDELTEQAPADDHRVGLGRLDVDAYRFGHD